MSVVRWALVVRAVPTTRAPSPATCPYLGASLLLVFPLRRAKAMTAVPTATRARGVPRVLLVRESGLNVFERGVVCRGCVCWVWFNLTLRYVDTVHDLLLCVLPSQLTYLDTLVQVSTECRATVDHAITQRWLRRSRVSSPFSFLWPW